MKIAIHLLIVSCIGGTLMIAPDSSGRLNPGVAVAAPSLATISGTVTDEKGVPLFGAIVSLLEQQPRGKEVKSVKTDIHGKFSTAIAPGVYFLRATAAGFRAKLSRVDLNRPININHNLTLKRTDTLVQQRGDSEDYRWIARGSPRNVLNLQEGETEETTDLESSETNEVITRRTGHPIHGMAQFIAVSSLSKNEGSAANFFGTNFAFSGSVNDKLELAFIGQRGTGRLAPQRISALSTFRPGNKHQITTSFGYGQAWTESRSLDQISFSTTASSQVFRPLLVIYGFDYSQFIGAMEKDSLLPRFALQYSPTSGISLNAAITPGTDQARRANENFSTENIQAGFEETPAEVAFNESPVLDRSRRFEVGMAKSFNDGDSALEFSAFYDVISGHGVGILALPLEASPETQATLQQVAHQVTAMDGAARGVRMIYRRDINEHISAAVGYSYGRGERFNQSSIERTSPARIFDGGFFQVATAKVDLDFTHETGTRVSTVIRLSPSAIVFAIDPFAGRMSVYDPNINIYVTQDLPNFGLPVRWQALVDVRNLFDQSLGVDDGIMQLIAARNRRAVRGGLAFRW